MYSQPDVRYDGIAALPNELLAVIFDHCRHDPDWMNILRVCRHWRDVALGCPCLWTKIDFRRLKNVKHLQACMHLSGSLPLDVNTGTIDEFTFPLLELVLAQASRVQYLDVSMSTYWLEKVLRLGRRMRSSARLKYLRLDIMRDTSDRSPTPVFSLASLFCGDLPRLVDFRLSSDIPMDGIIPAPNLRSLYLDFAGSLEVDPLVSGAVDLPSLLTSLGAMPRLESLDLSHAAGMNTSDSGRNHLRTVFLPQLKHLDIHGLTTSATRLLQHFVLPPTCSRVDIELQSMADDPDTAVPVLAAALQTLFSKTHLSGDNVALLGRTYGLSIVGAAVDDHFGLVVCPHTQRGACSFTGEDDAVCESAVFSLHLTDDSSGQLPLLLRAVPFIPQIRTVNIVGSPAEWPMCSVVDDELAADLLEEIASLPAVRRLEIIPRAFTEVVAEEHIRDVLPQLEDLVLPV